MFGKDPQASTPPLIATNLYPLSLFYFLFFIYFSFGLVLCWFGSWSI